jgi:hypothetical protein
MWAAEHERRERIQDAHKWEETVQSYLLIPNLKNRDRGEPYIRGKLVLLHDDDTDYAGHAPPLILAMDKPREEMSRTAKLPDFFFELPRELQAENPREVETIVWLKTIKTVVGEYPRTGDEPKILVTLNLRDYAYRYRKTLTVIDRTLPAVVGGAVFTGEDSLPERGAEGDRVFEKLNRNVVAFLASLPRK